MMWNLLMQVDWGLKGLVNMPNVHPLFVHFPIALLLTSLALYFAALFIQKGELAVAGKWMLYLGTVSAAVTVWTGLRAMNSVRHGGDVHQMMEVHKNFGYTILALSVLLSLWVITVKESFPAQLRWLFLTLFVVLGLIIVQSGDIGGRMVFLKGVAVKEQTASQSHAQGTGTHRESQSGHNGHEHAH